MKKYIIGMLVGFVLATTISAHAEVISMIGKQIQGQLPVKLNGAQLADQAIIVDGTSYLPVRAIGDALNLDTSFDATLGITLTNKIMPEGQKTPEQIAQEEKVKKFNILRKQSDDLTVEIVSLYATIEPYEKVQVDANGKTFFKEKDKLYEDTKTKRDALSAQRNEIEKQLNEIQKQ